jgi:sulfhydrogenase subunit delta
MTTPSKPRVAFFDFACCEGCQLTVLELGEHLLELLEHVDVVTWREVMTGESDQYDIAFCEGSITRQRDVDRLKRIRETAAIVVSLGSCASIGCHNAIRNRWSTDQLQEQVYGTDSVVSDPTTARPVSAVVPVDYQVLGCPISLSEFVTVFKHILTGKRYYPPNQPVCVECKLKDNVCVYEKGMVCLGPVTRCGCDAICTSYGDACHGCRGLVDDANWAAAVKALTDSGKHHPIMEHVVKTHKLTATEIQHKFAVYNGWQVFQNDTGPSDRSDPHTPSPSGRGTG